MFKSETKYAVIGLGSFGYTLAKLLSQRGLYVVAIDQDMDKVEKIKDKVAASVSFDATEADLLQKLGVAKVDVAIISVGDENFQAAEYIALELQDRGVNKIYVIVGSEREEQIIQKIGITDVINPKIEAAKNLADEISEQKSEV
ncbi:TrkA-N domain-containing protein [Fodinibius salinus]|uniref:TrkA-N domain-containing protein n=1 Tax=Fodinibius salinus TaxID=860790 RepID=A0A5D3YIX7_9BACT|nr:NAD-binding protein [Fodinibius salinus]TYP93733.1 TrkA-N domain-containing protein [Fodinibius salinus]